MGAKFITFVSAVFIFISAPARADSEDRLEKIRQDTQKKMDELDAEATKALGTSDGSVARKLYDLVFNPAPDRSSPSKMTEALTTRKNLLDAVARESGGYTNLPKDPASITKFPPNGQAFPRGVTKEEEDGGNKNIAPQGLYIDKLEKIGA